MEEDTQILELSDLLDRVPMEGPWEGFPSFAEDYDFGFLEV